MAKLSGYLLVPVLLSFVYYCCALDARQNSSSIATSGQSISNSSLGLGSSSSSRHGNNSSSGHSNSSLGYWTKSCDSIEVIIKRVDYCSKPLIDILQGTLKKWPRIDNDIIDMCQTFQESEKCIRDIGRKCAKGLQRVIISTFANSVQRVRKRECVRSRYPELLKAIRCVEQNQGLPQLLVANATSRLSVVQEQMKNPDQKTRAICCLINEIESEMWRLIKPVCPGEVATIVKLYRSVLEDVNQLLCTSPKCKDLFLGYKLPPVVKTRFEGMISHILRIVFSLTQ